MLLSCGKLLVYLRGAVARLDEGLLIVTGQVLGLLLQGLQLARHPLPLPRDPLHSHVAHLSQVEIELGVFSPVLRRLDTKDHGNKLFLISLNNSVKEHQFDKIYNIFWMYYHNFVLPTPLCARAP